MKQWNCGHRCLYRTALFASLLLTCTNATRPVRVTEQPELQQIRYNDAEAGGSEVDATAVNNAEDILAIGGHTIDTRAMTVGDMVEGLVYSKGDGDAETTGFGQSASNSTQRAQSTENFLEKWVARAHVLMVDATGEGALLQTKRNAVAGSWTLATTLTVNEWFFSRSKSDIDTNTLKEIQRRVFWESGCYFKDYTVYAKSTGAKEGGNLISEVALVVHLTSRTARFSYDWFPRPAVADAIAHAQYPIPGLNHRIDGHPQYFGKVVLPKVDSSEYWLLLDWAMEAAYPWDTSSNEASSTLNKAIAYLKSTFHA